MPDNTEKELIHTIVDQLRLPTGRWILSGSGVMVMHGINRKIRDLDIFVATQTWFSFLQRGWIVWTPDPDNPSVRCDPPYLYRSLCDVEVNLFFDWRRRGMADVDVNFWLYNAVIIDDVPCVPLQFLLDMKQERGQAKDVRDIQLIYEYLANA